MEAGAVYETTARERVTEACFFIHGDNDDDPSPNAEYGDFWEIGDFDEPEQCVKARYEAYTETWGRLAGGIRRQVERINENECQALADFVKNAHRQAGSAPRLSAANEIPTALLCTGVNTADHTAAFEHLCDTIEHVATPHIARVSGDAVSSLAALFKTVVLQLVNAAVNDDEEPIRMPTPTLEALEHWYCEEFCANERPPLVIMLENFEAFAPKLLHEFISALRTRAGTLPLVLVMGIATSFDVLHHNLPRSSHAALSTRRFHLQGARDTLKRIVNNVLMNAFEPISLSKGTFSYLISSFLSHDSSIKAFSEGLQDAVLEHFLTNPVSFLCAATPDTSLLTAGHCEYIRGLPSMRRYIEKLALTDGAGPRDLGKARALLTDDSALRSEVSVLLADLRRHKERLMAGVICFHAVLIGCNQSEMFGGSHVRNVYMAALKENLEMNPNFRAVNNALCQVPSHVLVEILERCVDSLKSMGSNDDIVLDLERQLNDFIKTLRHMIDNKLENKETVDTSLLGNKRPAQRRGSELTPQKRAKGAGSEGSPTGDSDSGESDYESANEGMESGEGEALDSPRPPAPADQKASSRVAGTPGKSAAFGGSDATPERAAAPANGQPATARKSVSFANQDAGESGSDNDEEPGENGIAWQGGKTKILTRRTLQNAPRAAAEQQLRIDTSKWSAAQKRKVALLAFASLDNELQPLELRVFSNYQKLRSEVALHLLTVFKRLLVTPLNKPLHEAVYVDAAQYLREHLGGKPRLSVQMALTYPGQYIDDPDARLPNLAPDDVTDILPDACIAYKLHLEYPRLINLYDWCQAFAAIVDEDLDLVEPPENRGGAQTQAEWEQRRRVVIARFTQAMNMLEYHGFIRGTKRKIDHVERLTWGSI